MRHTESHNRLAHQCDHCLPTPEHHLESCLSVLNAPSTPKFSPRILLILLGDLDAFAKGVPPEPAHHKAARGESPSRDTVFSDVPRA